MRPPFKTTWRVYLPGLSMLAFMGLVVYFARSRSAVIKQGHDFVPIYSEDGKLEGFTHPVLVNAGDRYREMTNKYSGGSVMAMAGKECFVIISDNRLGEQLKTVSMEVPKLNVINDDVVLGLTGLRTDQQTFMNKLRFRIELYKLREERAIGGKALAALIASLLYEARFGPWFVEPVLGSIDKKTGQVYLCAMDLIGAPCEPEDYVCAGTCANSLHGMCESLWRPNLEPEELFEVAAQAMLSACDRDSLSGYGAVAVIVTRDKMMTRLIKGRKD